MNLTWHVSGTHSYLQIHGNLQFWCGSYPFTHDKRSKYRDQQACLSLNQAKPLFGSLPNSLCSSISKSYLEIEVFIIFLEHGIHFFSAFNLHYYQVTSAAKYSTNLCQCSFSDLQRQCSTKEEAFDGGCCSWRRHCRRQQLLDCRCSCRGSNWNCLPNPLLSEGHVIS